MKGLVRGCGTRKKGGIYAEVPLSPFGMPLEHFLFDPPVIVNAGDLGITPVGVKLLKRANEDVYDVYDIVGADSYPNVADFVEEVRRFGISRRLTSSLDFSLLTDKSKIILMHSKAFIVNPDDFHPMDFTPREGNKPAPGCQFPCPKDIGEHNAFWHPESGASWPTKKPVPSCIGLWWHDIEQAEEWNKTDAEWDRTVQRTMPSFTYFGHSRPEGVTPQYTLAIFAAFPIGNIAVINDPEGNTHEMAMSKAQRAKLSVNLEDE